MAMAMSHAGMGLTPFLFPSTVLQDTKRSKFVNDFHLDSGKSGAQRELVEKRNMAQRLVDAQDWDGALDAAHAWAEMCADLEEQSGEAQAVLCMANCLSQKEEVDEELIAGMYSHVVKCAKAAEDTESCFQAFIGIASLKIALRKSEEAEQSLQKALDCALDAKNAKRIGYAYTRLAFLMLDNPCNDEVSSKLDVVNQDKEMVHVTRDGEVIGEMPAVRVGVAPRAKQALILLQQAKSSLTEIDHTPKDMATACMNLAVGFLKIDGAANKRKAGQEMMQAFRLLQSVSEDDPLVISVACKILEFHEGSPWVFNEDLVIASRDVAAKADKNRPPIDDVGVSSSREHRIEKERLRWAEEKLAAMRVSQHGDSDSEDENRGPARPTFEGWQRE